MDRFAKLSRLNGEVWQPHDHPRHFEREYAGDVLRLRVAVQAGTLEPVTALLPLLGEPILLLYVLHTPRGGGEAGRYQSGPLTQSAAGALLREFEGFFVSDGRHDLWFANRQGEQLVWDRHEVLFAYGRLAAFEATIQSIGYTVGPVQVSIPHQHSYHPELDHRERELLASRPWHRTELQPQDEQ